MSTRRTDWTVLLLCLALSASGAANLIRHLTEPKKPVYTCVGRFMNDGYWVVWLNNEQETAWKTSKETWDNIETDVTTEDPMTYHRFWERDKLYPRR